MTIYEYIKQCNKDELADLLTTLTMSICSQYGDTDDLTQDLIDLEKEHYLQWLDLGLPDNDYLN